MATHPQWRCAGRVAFGTAKVLLSCVGVSCVCMHISVCLLFFVYLCKFLKVLQVLVLGFCWFEVLVGLRKHDKNNKRHKRNTKHKTNEQHTTKTANNHKTKHIKDIPLTPHFYRLARNDVVVQEPGP